MYKKPALPFSNYWKLHFTTSIIIFYIIFLWEKKKNIPQNQAEHWKITLQNAVSQIVLLFGG